MMIWGGPPLLKVMVLLSSSSKTATALEGLAAPMALHASSAENHGASPRSHGAQNVLALEHEGLELGFHVHATLHTASAPVPLQACEGLRRCCSDEEAGVGQRFSARSCTRLVALCVIASRINPGEEAMRLVLVAVSAMLFAAPALAREASYGASSHRYYRSSDGSEVHGPTKAANPDYGRVTATCGDGTSSYSHHRAGTCSGHGGVGAWK